MAQGILIGVRRRIVEPERKLSGPFFIEADRMSAGSTMFLLMLDGDEADRKATGERISNLAIFF